jgi:hypothetical protein
MTPADEFAADLFGSEAADDAALACVAAAAEALERAIAEVQPIPQPAPDLAAETARTDAQIAAAVAAVDELLASLSWPEPPAGDTTQPGMDEFLSTAGSVSIELSTEFAGDLDSQLAAADDPLPRANTAKQIEAIKILIALNQERLNDASAAARLFGAEKLRWWYEPRRSPGRSGCTPEGTSTPTLRFSIRASGATGPGSPSA